MKKEKLSMKLLSTTLDFFGVWEVDVIINDKFYKYVLDSEYAVNKFLSYYNKGLYRSAAAVIDHYSTKKITSERKDTEKYE